MSDGEVDVGQLVDCEEAVAELEREIRMVRERNNRLEAEAKRLRKAITDCLDYANGRQYEWGSRAESAFEILENAID